MTKKPGKRGATLSGLPEAAMAALDDLIASAEREDLQTMPAEKLDMVEIEDHEEPDEHDEPDDPRADSQDFREPEEPSFARHATNARTDHPRMVTSSPLDDNQFVEETELGELPTLRFAVLEDPAHVASAQVAIGAAGHAIELAAASRGDAEVIADAMRDGEIDAVLVGLPGGELLIDAALALAPRRPVVIAAVDEKGARAVARAHAAGADLVTVRPHDLDRLAPVLLGAARLHVERSAALQVAGSEQVLRARLEDIADPDGRGLEAFELFQHALEREIKRAKRYEYPLSVALFALDIDPPPPPAGIRGILRARAGNALVHTIRDIDLATQVDHDRFLVLLPYTDLRGATELARRVIAAVAEGAAVVSSGRSFPPRVVGAVAGGRPGQPLSFAHLMKTATQALEQARRDGAELAVQP
jgi:two-component system cell cycle response regulator